MESINQQIWQTLRKDPAIMRGLERKLINTRALAKHLITTCNLRASLDSVISSIRRFPMSDFKKEHLELLSVFRDSVIGTTNNMACVTIPQDPKTVLQKVSGVSLPLLRIVTGSNETKLIVKNGFAEKLAELFNGASIEHDLSEVNVSVAETAVKTKGVLAKITGELAIANINIHELLVCPPEFLIYVSEKDIVKAHERILSLTEN